MEGFANEPRRLQSCRAQLGSHLLGRGGRNEENLGAARAELGPHGVEEGDSVHPWHPVVDERKVGGVEARQFQGLLSVRCAFGLVPHLLDADLQRFSDDLYVIDNENSGHGT